ncbi:MAG: hypothetical protein AAGJ93_00040 [Bacteroidota bacterium]
MITTIRASLLVSLLLLINSGCTGSAPTDLLLKESFQIHQQALQLAEETHEILLKLPKDDPYRVGIESRLEAWSNNLVEVPGFEHDHHHGHHHHHGPQLELTPEDMLIVQKELRDSASVIKEDLRLYVEQK